MNELKLEDLICFETRRLTEKYKKDFLDLQDVMKITNLGRDKVREMFNSKNFPLTKFGRRQTVSVLSFVTWQFKNNTKGDIYD